MRRVAALALLLAVALAGCGGLKKGGLTPVGSDEATTAPAGAKSDVQVQMIAIRFKPDPISVKRGGTVTWTNRDKVAHTVTEGDELYNVFNSGNVEPGKTYRRKFNKAGKISYRCTIHPNMDGTIFVR